MSKIKPFLFVVFSGIVFMPVFGQKYITKEGVIDIFSETSLFVIKAKNQKVASILDISNGEVVASTLIRSFKFKEALVEEHFNENYMESHTYPKSAFKGKITNFSSINFKKEGVYDMTYEGELTIHSTTKPLKGQGKITVTSQGISVNTTFPVSLKNFTIKIEDMYKNHIKDEITLTIDFDYSPMTQ